MVDINSIELFRDMRFGEGDHLCDREQVSAFYRDAALSTIDMKVLKGLDLSVFDNHTVRDYRNYFEVKHSGHVWNKQDDEMFLRNIGALGFDREDGKIYPTLAGLLMFGHEYDIVRECPDYFLDYREIMEPGIRCKVTYSPARTVMTINIEKYANADNNSGKVTENSEKFIERVIEKFIENGDKVTENRLSIIRLILATPTISKIELADKTGISVTSVSNNLKYMRGKYIRREGPDKGEYWEII